MNFSDDNGLLAIRVKNSPNQIAAIKIIREATQLSLVEIKTALAEQSPFFGDVPFVVKSGSWSH